MSKNKYEKITEMAYDALMRKSIREGSVECPRCGPVEEGRETGCSLCEQPKIKIVLPKFALSHFDNTKHPPAIPGISPEQFELEINERLPEVVGSGYASFCRLMWFKNWTKAKCGIVPIMPEVEPFIKTEYDSRRETELPVLMRYFPGSMLNIRAKYLCVIIYDKKQMEKEGSPINGDFAVVNILRTMTMEEPPLPPITIMRNALGVAEGGSGVPIDRKKYMESVEFWNKHVAVKPG